MSKAELLTTTHSQAPFDLELIDGPPVAPGSQRVLFVHGICHGAWTWRNYMHAFAEHQIGSTALSLRGHAGSSGRDQLDEFGLEDYVDDVLSVVGASAAQTIVVGHSMGGAIVQLALQRPGVEFAGAVLLTPMVPGGHNFVEMARLMLSGRSYLNLRKIVRGNVLSPAETNRTAFFDGRLSADDAAWAASNLQAESKRAMDDLNSFEPPAEPLQTPMYVLGSSKDTIFRASTLRRTAEHYGLQADVMSEGCHDLMLDPTWQVSADRLIRWIKSLDA